MATDVRQSNTNFGRVTCKQIIYEDEQCIVFDEDENKQAPVHFIVAPRKIIPRLSDASVDDEKLLGHLLIVARHVAKVKYLGESGFRVVMNDGVHGGHLLLVAKKLAIEKRLHNSGYHVMVDENHRTMRLNSLHVFGRALHHMLWPVGPGCRL